MSAKKFTIMAISSLAIGTVLVLSLGCGKDDKVNGPVPLPVPALVVSVNGNFFKAVMGDTIVDRALNFAVRDGLNNNLSGQWVHLSLLDGDGSLLADSILTDSTGIAHLTYSFDSSLGHATIQFLIKSIDTAAIDLRANTLIPGIGGQGQYILFTNKFIDVKNYNGNPNSIDVDPSFFVTYANYETALHVVFVINDLNRDTLAQNTEDVLAVLLTSDYTGKTKDSIGIGSSYNEIKAVYGAPTSVVYDPTPPPALVISYDNLGMTFFTSTVTGSPIDTIVTVFEIHMSDFVTPKAPVKVKEMNTQSSVNVPGHYRRFRQ